MLTKVKMALRITTNVFDDELNDLISAALLDLGVAGVISNNDALVTRAVITYCKLYFGEPSDRDFERLKSSYDEQKAQLSTATNYTDWGVLA